ncbi:thiamine phosphate synthase [Kordiimonas laminariae]|uniref:thiamine phosphate synthase n=1 Tax=Kordiimonas laminariae TaxID=2917717 RepID=UPI001FF680EC|nr:thiamine phosphate synthase [Kordiimonas laminariae]MCK0068340.1 thiamine phosphate synthase [Kordiimonas laminariae]
MAKTKEPCELYLLTPDTLDDVAAFAADLDAVLATEMVPVVQVRLKDVDDETFTDIASQLKDVCHKHDVAVIINDRVDIAKAIGADGVHIGQDDMSLEDARNILGEDFDIGVTCHNSRHLAYEAGEGGANYVAFGAFFPSVTKANAEPAEIEILQMWEEVTDIPCVAIGGITTENCRSVADAGAHFVAVCAGVWQHEAGPVAAVKAYHQALNS